MDKKVIPTVLTDTIESLEEQVSRVESFVDYVQVDYVDGYFAPELTCCEAKLIREVEFLTALEVHLMVEEPIMQVKDWYKAGADRIIGHIEEMEDQQEFVAAVTGLGIEVGLALKLTTPLEDLDHSIVDGLDVVLLMAHEVGVQKAPFDDMVLPKIKGLRERYPNLNIEVDGGVNHDTISKVLDAGANLFAVGSDIFGDDDPRESYEELVKLIT